MPNQAFLEKDQTIADVEADHKLWTMEGNTFKAHKVEIGTSNGVLTEITGGVAAGTVVLSDFNVASTGQGEQHEQANNPFMPRRPNNRNNNNRSGNAGNNGNPGNNASGNQNR